jgi:tetratricopeptide (TPR) repeat protein
MAAASQAAIIIMGNDLPTEPMPLGIEEQRYLEFGSVTYDFYSDHRFAALNKLLVNRKEGLFDADTEYAELILGTLYVSFGLPEQADAIFNRLLEKDILAQTRARTWLEKAMLEYARRHLVLANIRIQQGEFGEALASLHAIPGRSLEGGYATYNMGVAMIRADHVGDGVQMLQSVMNMDAGDEEINALKDRAALAIGLTELKRKNFDASREALLTIRADGPFSNEALLALGLTNYERKQYKKSLPVLLELVRRNSSHNSVQEALMLAPRAYEELGALPQALAGYQFAAQSYREELKQVERAIRNIDDPSWIDQLMGDSGAELNNTDPMAARSSYSINGGPEMGYLYKLFASHEFNELFQQYVELDRTLMHLRNWQQEMPALMQAFVNQQSKLGANLPGVKSNLVQVRGSQRQLGEKAADLSVSIPQTLDMRNPQDLASLPQLIMWEKIQQIEAALDGRPSSVSTRAYQERVRRARGLLLFTIAEDAHANREKQFEYSTRLLEQTDLLAVRAESVEQLVKDATLHVRGDIASKLNAKTGQIENLIQQTEDLMQQMGQVLKNNALRVLAQSRRRLGDQLGEAHLAMARLQDASVVEKIEQGIAQ